MDFHLLWIIFAAFIGFGISAIFSGYFRLPRNIYLFSYIPLVAAFFYIFVDVYNIDMQSFVFHNFYWGLLGAAIATMVVIQNVISQPSSATSKGYKLIFDIFWPGFAYGLIDVLLLTIIPVLSVKFMVADASWFEAWGGKIGFGMIALFASLFVTTAYHIGYTEFRGKKLFGALIGNGILTLGYILTMNPLAAILPHIIMHITAMIHGKETTGQVPPHYNNMKNNSLFRFA